MPFCANCGKEVVQGIKFCPECGKGLKKESSSMVVWGYVCGGIALLTKGRTGHGIAQIVIASTLGILGSIWGAIVWGG